MAKQAKKAATAEKHDDVAEAPVKEKAAVAKAAPASDHGPAAGHGAHGAHGAHHAPNRKEYFVMFGVLLLLTVLEVGVAQLPGLDKLLMRLALVGLALTKAVCVGLYYMHMKSETRVLKLAVVIPMATPAIYALVLITEAAWRLLS